MKALTENPEGERPDWIPEGVWPSVRDDLVAIKCRVSKKSLGQISDKYGLPLNRISNLMTSGAWRLNVEETRQQLADGSAIIAHTMMRALHADVEDPDKLAKMSPRDKSIVFKNMTDNHLNASNGMVGSPAIGTANFNDIKMLFAAPVKKPGEL